MKQTHSGRNPRRRSRQSGATYPPDTGPPTDTRSLGVVREHKFNLKVGDFEFEKYQFSIRFFFKFYHNDLKTILKPDACQSHGGGWGQAKFNFQLPPPPPPPCNTSDHKTAAAEKEDDENEDAAARDVHSLVRRSIWSVRSLVRRSIHTTDLKHHHHHHHHMTRTRTRLRGTSHSLTHSLTP